MAFPLLSGGRLVLLVTIGHGESKGMKKTYAAPTLVEYGRIADCTFATPGGTKGCKINCHIDKFGEQSALAGS